VILLGYYEKSFIKVSKEVFKIVSLYLDLGRRLNEREKEKERMSRKDRYVDR
jgi:hypothetical protein